MSFSGTFSFPLRLEEITYKITSHSFGYGYRDGLAVDFDLPVHVCIHQKIDGFWYADEFLTGCSFGNESLNKTSNMVLFLKDLYLSLQEKVESGQYEKLVQKQIQKSGKK